MLEICLRLNIRCVSAYTFSIENFKRDPDEVDALMGLAEEKLLELCEHGCVFMCYTSIGSRSTAVVPRKGTS